MEIILIIATVLIGAVLNLVIKPGIDFACKLAKVYILWVLIILFSSCLLFFGGIKSAFVNEILGQVANWGKYPGRLMLACLVANILMAVHTEENNYPLKKITGLTLWGVSIMTGGSFLIATAGKATSFAGMVAFFTASGYATWFLYFIMIAESLGAIGILLHFKLKTGPWAATGLMLIMIGAMYTHRHNNDPFSDSYAAVGQLITLSLMLVIYYSESRVAAPGYNITLT